MPKVPTTHRSIRLASIEPLEPLNRQVRQIAKQFSLTASADPQTCENAPFCGYDVYYQNFILKHTGEAGDSANEQMAKCIDAIGKLTEETIADGFLEVLE